MDTTAGDDGTAIAIPIDFDGSWQVGVAFEKAQTLQGVEVVVHCRRRCESDGVTNFAH